VPSGSEDLMFPLAAHTALISEICLRHLCNFRSIAGSEAEIGAFVAGHCGDIGLAVGDVEA
jgi:hypothetical protein